MKLSKDIFIIAGLLIGVYMITISAFVTMHKDGAVGFGILGFIIIIFCLYESFNESID